MNSADQGDNLEVLYYTCRSRIALGQYQEALAVIEKSPVKTVELDALRILVQYFSDPATRAESVEKIALLLNEELGNTPLVRILACTIYNNENDYDHAYLTVKNAETIEELSVLAYTLVRMNRPDKASAVYSQMCKIDEDHILTQLTKTWINANGDNEKLKENTYIYHEIMDKLNESPMLMTNYLMTTLRSDNHALDREQVEKCYNGLLEEYGKNPRDACVLRNLVVVASIMHQPDEEVEKYLKELEAVNPEDTMVVTSKNMLSRMEQLETELA